MAIIDMTGGILQRFEYDPYGLSTCRAAQWSMTTDAYSWTARLTGQMMDGVTAVYTFRTRNMNPASGRFCTRDLLSEHYERNLYQYVDSRPTTGLDPNGLDTLDFTKKFWGGSVPKAVGVDVTGSAVLGPGMTLATQAVFFEDTCEIGFYGVTPAIFGAPPAKTLKGTLASMAKNLPWGYDISISANGSAAYYSGPGPANAASWAGIFYGGTLSGGFLGKAGIGGFSDPQGNWKGGSVGVGVSATPGLMPKSNPQMYYLWYTLKLPVCICYPLILSIP